MPQAFGMQAQAILDTPEALALGSVPIVGVTTSFGRRGLQPARANGASPGTVILHQHHAALPSFSSMAAMT